MKFSNKFKVRVTSLIWLIYLCVIVPFWWMLCIVERIMNGNFRTYRVIVVDAYKLIFKDFGTTIKDIRSGKATWR